MTKIDLNKIPWSYQNKVIIISEKGIPFDTEYSVMSPSGGIKEFKFTHSTGPEFDVNTKWMYKSDDGLQLAVCNDAQMVKAAAAAYLKAKTGNR